MDFLPKDSISGRLATGRPQPPEADGRTFARYLQDELNFHSYFFTRRNNQNVRITNTSRNNNSNQYFTDATDFSRGFFSEFLGKNIRNDFTLNDLQDALPYKYFTRLNIKVSSSLETRQKNAFQTFSETRDSYFQAGDAFSRATNTLLTATESDRSEVSTRAREAVQNYLVVKGVVDIKTRVIDLLNGVPDAVSDAQIVKYLQEELGVNRTSGENRQMLTGIIEIEGTLQRFDTHQAAISNYRNRLSSELQNTEQALKTALVRLSGTLRNPGQAVLRALNNTNGTKNAYDNAAANLAQVSNEIINYKQRQFSEFFFTVLDIDGNGRVNLETETPAFFAVLDQNGDGLLAAQERHTMKLNVFGKFSDIAQQYNLARPNNHERRIREKARAVFDLGALGFLI